MGLTKGALFPCPSCGRDGATCDDGHAICRRCEGLGDCATRTEQLLTAARHLLDCSQASEPQECEDCGGCGKMGANNHPDEAPCPACNGTGKTKPFEVEALRALECAVSRFDQSTRGGPDG